MIASDSNHPTTVIQMEHEHITLKCPPLFGRNILSIKL